jgi:hypothetical protein
MIYKPWAIISMCKEYRCKSVVNHDYNMKQALPVNKCELKQDQKGLNIIDTS